MPTLPGGLPRSPLTIGIMILLLICLVPIYLFMGGGDSDTQTPLEPPAQIEDSEPTVQVEQPTARPTRTPGPTRTPAPAGAAQGATWTVMLYQDADDKILEQDIYVDLNEAERVGSSEQVQIVAQLDRFRAGYTGDGDWTSARRYYVTNDPDLNRIGSDLVEELGEVNMADAGTLIDFVAWAVENYPAEKYALILSDHGMGWPGGWSDPTATGGGDRNLPLSSAIGDQLYLHEIDQALGEIRQRTGVEQFELLGMDACLMGHLEVYSALQPHARYAVASQETEPALGWAYAAFLEALAANPGMNGAELGEQIVNSYIRDDQRIVDDQARADFIGRGSPLQSLFGASSGPSAAQITQQLFATATLSAVDLQKLPALMQALNELVVLLQGSDQRSVAQARSYAQSFTSVFGREVPPSYIDLGNFVELAARTGGQRDIAEAANSLQTELENVVIANINGPKKPGANGVSIYFPNSQLYQSPMAGPQSYNVAAERFATESLWDEFLVFHYTGRSFEAGERAPALPLSGETVRAPAAGGITVSPLELSDDSAAPGEPVLISADIEGQNVGYVRLLVGYLDRASSSIFVADSDYLEAPGTREVDGVYYPDWGQGEFRLEFEWEPIVFAISDGSNTAVALLQPNAYGATPEEAVYTVDGLYAFADGGETRRARLYFSNGALRQVFGFTGQEATGAPREIIPQTGDSFTILELWYDLDAQGNVVETARQEGETLTFSDQTFTWVEMDAAVGDYIVGFIVEDLDGNSQTVFGQVTVR